MRILVTGGAGFVGTNLIKRLLSDGHEVVSVDNYTTGKKENELPGCTYYDFDLSSKHLLGLYVDQTTYPTWRDDDYDLIFHLAAQPIVRRSYDDPVETFTTNAIGSMNILEAVRESDSVKSMVMITSDKAYRNVEWIWGYKEDDLLGGEDPYSSSKGCAELIFYSYVNSYFKNNE